MTTGRQGARGEGVGIAYHPFLHAAILRHQTLFDFVELPMNLYLDPARSGLLDPGGERLQEVQAAMACVWRGTALSVGSVEPGGDTGYPASLTERMRRLIGGAGRYTDAIGFRRVGGRDLGLLQGMRLTEPAARWVAARHRAAEAALGVPVVLQVPASNAGDAAAAGFLRRVAELAGCRFDLAARDLARCGRAHVATVAVTGEADWPALTGANGARAIVLRRERNLFPLDTIAAEARQAAAMLAGFGPAETAGPGLNETASCTAGELAVLHEEQRALAGTLDTSDAGGMVRSWQTWQAHMTDTHKAQQIATFLARGFERRAAGER